MEFAFRTKDILPRAYSSSPSPLPESTKSATISIHFITISKCTSSSSTTTFRSNSVSTRARVFTSSSFPQTLLGSLKNGWLNRGDEHTIYSSLLGIAFFNSKHSPFGPIHSFLGERLTGGVVVVEQWKVFNAWLYLRVSPILNNSLVLNSAMSLSHRRIGIQMISNNEISKCCTRQGLVTAREEVGDEMWGEEVLGGAIHRSTGPFQWELLHYQMGNEEIPVKRRAPPVLILLPSSSSAHSHSVLLSSLSPSLLMMTYKQEDVEFKQRRDDYANNCHPS